MTDPTPTTTPTTTETVKERYFIETYERANPTNKWDAACFVTLQEARDFKPIKDGDWPQRILHRLATVRETEVK